MKDIIYDWYNTLCCYKTIHKINNFVKANREILNSQEKEIVYENKYVSHTIAILVALGIQTVFHNMKRLNIFRFRPYLPISFGILTSSSFLYVHNLYMSRKTINKLIHLYLMSTNEKGLCNKIDQIYKTEEPSDYSYLTRNIS
ncbi:hypothetical protein PGSY75_0810700 [Plasmodium gaboni]|uniref:Uncharacterized protein n=1 Tax=Plasmodium gaboni TaxID=647221 RepID=A0A151LNL6_9APIC|nr:hypothetical protein PGSY75_0810700 [Plasmodium gaboni]KYO00699.1 hypothetical protein PGSY75_0810700 [Plasmodium gaboni]